MCRFCYDGYETRYREQDLDEIAAIIEHNDKYEGDYDKNTTKTRYGFKLSRDKLKNQRRAFYKHLNKNKRIFHRHKNIYHTR